MKSGKPIPQAPVAALPPKPRAPGRFPSAAAFIPATRALPQLRAAADACRGCDLYKNATQAVFGEGPKAAAVMLIGEQPGDKEDVDGHPFIGPAGQLLRHAMEEAGLPIKQVYLTNAVKHFKWLPRGKKRLHQKPAGAEIAACRPWLEREIEVVQPRLIVALGATAAQTLLGPSFRVTRDRGRVIEGTAWGRDVLATVHPSSILRAPDQAARAQQHAEFVRDLKAAATAAGFSP